MTDSAEHSRIFLGKRQVLCRGFNIILRRLMDCKYSGYDWTLGMQFLSLSFERGCRNHAPTVSGVGLGTASSGAACSAGFAFLPIFPLRLLSIASATQSATSLSRTGRPALSSPAASSAASSSSSEIVGGLSRGVSQGWRSNNAYVGRSLGVLFRQPRTNSLA